MIVICMEYRVGSNTKGYLSCHIVWVTKYRYRVLTWDIKVRCRDLIVQICDAEDVKILKGVVSSDHVHMHVEYPPSLSLSDLVKRLKWRTSRKLQEEYDELKRRYRWRHFRAIWYAYRSTWVVTQDMIQDYLEHHRSKSKSNKDLWNMILE